MTALHDLTGQYLKLANDEDLPADAIADTLEALEGTIHEKAQSLADWSLDMDGNILKIDAAIERLADKKKSIQKRKESLIEYLLMNMEASGIKKITCPLFNITYVEGSDIVEITDESALPDDYVSVKTTVSPDKVLIKKALKDGYEVAGARLGKGKSSIRIK